MQPNLRESGGLCFLCGGLQNLLQHVSHMHITTHVFVNRTELQELESSSCRTCGGRISCPECCKSIVAVQNADGLCDGSFL